MDIEGTSAVVTGAASGLGEGMARLLAERGQRVVVADMNEERGRAVAEEIGGVFVRTDVTTTDDVVAAVDAAVGLAPLRTLATFAGIAHGERTIGRDGTYESAHDLDAYRRVIEVNLIGSFNCLRIAATAMSHNEPDADGCRGAAVLVSSVAAFEGQIGQAAYSSTKGGLVGLTLPAARDLAVVGVRVNTLAPGLIDTPIYDTMPDPDSFKVSLASDVVFPKRLGTAQEVAHMGLELLTNSYMNGQVVRVDGAIKFPPKS